MAEVGYSLDVSRMDRAVHVYMQGVTEEAVVGYGKKVKAEVVRLIHERADEETPGGLADSVYGQPFFDGPNEVSVIIASDAEHALWFEEGTGIHGPRNQPIFPRAGRFMIFTPRGLTRRVFAQRVEGQPGKHPFRDGLENVVARGGLTPI